MSDTTASQPQGAGRYDIRLQGHLAGRWAARLGGMTLTQNGDGTTLISGDIIDQAALHGLLNQVRDLGLPLLSVTRVDPETPPAALPAHTAKTSRPAPPESSAG